MNSNALLLINAIQAVIAEAPEAIALGEKGKEFIEAMFSAGIVTREQQNALKARVDDICAALLAGEVPPAWQVSEDPQS